MVSGWADDGVSTFWHTLPASRRDELPTLCGSNMSAESDFSCHCGKFCNTPWSLSLSICATTRKENVSRDQILLSPLTHSTLDSRYPTTTPTRVPYPRESTAHPLLHTFRLRPPKSQWHIVPNHGPGDKARLLACSIKRKGHILAISNLVDSK